MMSHDKSDWPDWLKEAEISDDAVLTIEHGVVVWHKGTWYNGTWHSGTWHNGTWENGIWEDGTWHNGTWYRGLWRDGTWYDGIWEDGTWENGIWYNGTWHNGTWYDGIRENGIWYGGIWHKGLWRDGIWYDGIWSDGLWINGEWRKGTWNGGTWYNGTWNGGTWSGMENRLLYMASTLGIVFDEQGYGVAYRTTNHDRSGRWNSNFIQPEGEYFDEYASQAGRGLCCPGSHVTTAAKAWSMFGIDSSCLFWKVTFHKDDLLDCDGDKARIRGGTYKLIDRPF